MAFGSLWFNGIVAYLCIEYNVILYCTNLLYTGNPKTGHLANSEDFNEMQHCAAFNQGMNYLLR